jgi:hypothetical protein
MRPIDWKKINEILEYINNYVPELDRLVFPSSLNDITTI